MAEDFDSRVSDYTELSTEICADIAVLGQLPVELQKAKAEDLVRPYP